PGRGSRRGGGPRRYLEPGGGSGGGQPAQQVSGAAAEVQVRAGAAVAAHQPRVPAQRRAVVRLPVGAVVAGVVMPGVVVQGVVLAADGRPGPRRTVTVGPAVEDTGIRGAAPG